MKIRKFDATLATGGQMIKGRLGSNIAQDIAPSGALIEKTVYEFYPAIPSTAQPAKTGTVCSLIYGRFDVKIRKKNNLVYELDPIQ